MQKKNIIKQGKKTQAKTVKNSLEKEIDEMIDREKTKGKIVNNLLNLKKSVEAKFDFP